jgi:methyl coenzyme M reductase subunit D
MNQPTPEQLAKLPKWAQEHITDLSRQRDAALNVLNEFQDSQTVSRFYYEDHVCTGEQAGPSSKRRYIQTDRVIVDYKGEEFELTLARGRLQLRCVEKCLALHMNCANTVNVEPV